MTDMQPVCRVAIACYNRVARHLSNFDKDIFHITKDRIPVNCALGISSSSY